MIITTKTKVSLAGLAYRAVALSRAAVGKRDWVTVRRRGLRWRLDLAEGIDFSIYLLGAFERSTADTLAKLARPGDVAFDIGANVGAHTLGLARSVGPAGVVYAVEPADFAFEKLKANVALNPDIAPRVRPRQLLLAADPAAPRPSRIYASWPLRNTASVHPKHRGRLVSAAGASVDTLDALVQREGLARLDLIKMDVDGHEYPVLKGGLATLARFRPILVMEMQPYGHEEQLHGFDGLVALLAGFGYTLQDAATWQPVPLDTARLVALIPDGANLNVIARRSDS